MFFSRSFVVVVYCQFKVYMSFVSVRITRPSVWQKCNLSFIYSQCDRRNAKCLKFVDWEDIQHCSFRDANFSVKNSHPDWIFAFREKYEYQMSTSALWKAWSAAQNANNIQWMCHVTCVCVCAPLHNCTIPLYIISSKHIHIRYYGMHHTGRNVSQARIAFIEPMK